VVFGGYPRVDERYPIEIKSAGLRSISCIILPIFPETIADKGRRRRRAEEK
jgi:hypothetical protein